ncbi:MAG: hypothetical protein A2Y82_01550 [Candidatus Buchananbacteria bacterium RBG_13_36_9]|uniref:Metallo-beta-lactamase domain-containing protein n=1 Tax=Candidatus Buchananbacteria bacterium RBG_13_36_9 TaxID=1797530 RepID=A0A1G1XMD9_9BACT|nr:MAG: hypothetical protein A2Y82_01550 [Candidatus Buchananbacteria bacterium RBG_13_36_9]
MGFEIDYLPVGEGEKGGDAIAIRYGNLLGRRDEQTIIIIDGGNKDSGQSLVNHVKKYYNTDIVDLVVSSHLHSDHASGLTEVLENLKVGKLAMHLPWNHADPIKNMFTDGRITAKGLEEKLEKSLQTVKDLETIATNKGIPIIEPFTGMALHGDNIFVLGPSEAYYRTLLANFTVTPEPKKIFSLPKAFVSFGKEAVKWVAESLDIETLDDDDGTNPENHSSTILLLVFDDKKFLFTGDAGIPALTEAANYANNNGVPLDDLYFLDVPHHGSKRNVGPTILNRIKAQVSYISVPTEGDPKHPSKKVTNALNRRKSQVYQTKGQTLCRRSDDAPVRENWGQADPVPFHDEVEE